MQRDLQLSPDLALPGPLRRATAAVLIAASAALARLAARLEARAVSTAPLEQDVHIVEFSAVEIDGRRHGAVYANGRLVGYLTDVPRL
jgi:hypothetical protein